MLHICLNLYVVIYSQKPQELLNLLFTEERYWALFYMPLYTFLHNLLNVLVEIANIPLYIANIPLIYPCRTLFSGRVHSSREGVSKVVPRRHPANQQAVAGLHFIEQHCNVQALEKGIVTQHDPRSLCQIMIHSRRINTKGNCGWPNFEGKHNLIAI
jgi:hypothetical protein